MKFSLVDSDKKETISYPCLRQSAATGTIVLFVGRNEGISVYRPGGDEIGVYDEGWHSADDGLYWTTPSRGVLLEP